MKGVSIIACTKRPDYMINLFDNYDRQIHKKKELIIVLNNDLMNIKQYQKMAKKYKNITVYQLPEKTSLGECLNFAIEKTRYSYVAKFDDDDFYAPFYLTDYIEAFKKTGADIIGKKAHYLWLEGKKVLILRYPGSENKFEKSLPGATLVMKRKVFDKVRFSDQSNSEDTQFCIDCKEFGFKIYSLDRYNFVAVRRRKSKDHTWIVSDKRLLSRNVEIISDVVDYKEFATRPASL